MAQVDRGSKEHFWWEMARPTAIKISNYAHLTSAIDQSSTAMLLGAGL